jgi:hypothetical protein
MHYLMERRQEQDYNDPFELLKNMNDVIMAYDPKERKLVNEVLNGSTNIERGADLVAPPTNLIKASGTAKSNQSS